MATVEGELESLKNLGIGMVDEAAGVCDFRPLCVHSIARHPQQLLIEAERPAGFPAASAACERSCLHHCHEYPPGYGLLLNVVDDSIQNRIQRCFFMGLSGTTC